MKRITLISLISLLFIAAFPAALMAQETGEDGNFVSELARELGEQGWSESQLQELVSAAQELNWEEASEASPEVVALALQYGERRSGEDEDGELSGLEQAQLALELAISAQQMEQVGIEQRDIARASLQGARDAIGEIQAWREGGREGNLGERIREKVASSVLAQVRETNQAMGRGRAGQVLGNLGELPGGQFVRGGGDFTGGEEDSDVPGTFGSS